MNRLVGETTDIRHVRGSTWIYDVRMAKFVLKIEKLSHIILGSEGARGFKTYGVHSRFFTITAEIHSRSLAKFYGQYEDRHMNLNEFVRRVSERERGIRQSVIVKNKY